MEQQQQVSLGCGTLILIALIVTMCSQPRSANIENNVREVRSKVDQIQFQLDQQDKKLREQLDLIGKQNRQITALTEQIRQLNQKPPAEATPQ